MNYHVLSKVSERFLPVKRCGRFRRVQIQAECIFQSHPAATRRAAFFTPYQWHVSTIAAILKRMDCCEHTVNFKGYSKSRKAYLTTKDPISMKRWLKKQYYKQVRGGHTRAVLQKRSGRKCFLLGILCWLQE